MIREHNCSNCIYSEKKAHPQIVGQLQIFCYRFPPQIVAVPVVKRSLLNGAQETQVQLNVQATPVTEEIWCYEHPEIKEGRIKDVPLLHSDAGTDKEGDG